MNKTVTLRRKDHFVVSTPVDPCDRFTRTLGFSGYFRKFFRSSSPSKRRTPQFLFYHLVEVRSVFNHITFDL